MQTVSIGPLGFSFAHLLLVFSFVVALLVGALYGRKHGVSTGGTLVDTLLVALVTARIGFVAQYFEHFKDAPLDIIDIRDGGFSVYAGVFGAVAFGAWRMLRRTAIRKPLGIAILSGLMTWGALSLTVNLIEGQAREIPDSGLSTLDDESITLVDLQPGKPKVVNIWASWCPPCIREMPVLERAQERYPDITFVFVNQGEQVETITSFLKQQELSIRNVLSDVSGSLANATGSHALPTTLFYDAEGRQVDAHMGELSNASLAQKLEAFERK
ncbi:prolipoprotein diacylglyceryl transferase family protein [Marinobacter sp.]|uniref:prolipoprotein diacylglyceryl transferase family protein n=1 Tax=Marinobacter sp. TaxID=50741 RepID=UPI00384EC3CD